MPPRKRKTKRKRRARREASEKIAKGLVVSGAPILCDYVRGCQLRARWQLQSVDDPDDYMYACNQHLGRICEKIVQDSKVRYDITYLRGKK